MRSFIMFAMLFSASCVPGPQGEQGPAGPTGAYPAIAKTSCTAKAAALPGYMKTWHYESATLADELRIVSCAAEDSAATYGVTRFYKPSDEGYTTGACVFTYDVGMDAALTGGQMSCSQPAGALPSCTFVDPFSAADGFTVAFTEGDCQ
jgi:hypothetical protein